MYFVVIFTYVPTSEAESQTLPIPPPKVQLLTSTQSIPSIASQTSLPLQTLPEECPILNPSLLTPETQTVPHRDLNSLPKLNHQPNLKLRYRFHP